MLNTYSSSQQHVLYFLDYLKPKFSLGQHLSSVSVNETELGLRRYAYAEVVFCAGTKS